MSKLSSQQIAELEAEIRRHQRLYYDLNEPEITDAEFDKLWEQLQACAPDSPVLNERSQDHFGAEFKHVVPMGSLSKYKTVEELFSKFEGFSVTETPKIDGASLALHYDNHRLVMAVTRGRTETGKGKIVTANVAMISNVPKSISVDGKVEVRGEACILRKAFYGIMDQPGYDGFPKGYANPRNAASGGLTCQDPAETKNRNLSFIGYKIINTEIQSYADQLESLEKWGFTVPPCNKILAGTMEDMENLVRECAAARKDLPYDTDGMVVRFDLESVYQEQGVTGVCPNGAAAYKFEAEQAETKLLDIEWETGRVGYVHPVGVLETVSIGGSNVSRCTLNNISWMKSHGDPLPGSTVIIQKCGDIIPGLVAVTHRGTGATNWPEKCPSCGNTLQFHKNSDGSEGVRLWCSNKLGCPAQFRDGILHMLRKLEVKGIAEATLDRIIGEGMVTAPWEIFDLKASQLVSKGFGNRESEIIEKSLAGVSAPVPNILAAVGVNMWGRRMFTKLMANSTDFDEIRLLAGDFKKDELAGIHEIGGAKAAALSEAFGSGC